MGHQLSKSATVIEPYCRNYFVSFQNEQTSSSTKNYGRTVPPRFQKQQDPAMSQNQRQQPPSPGSSGSSGHPPGPPMTQVFRSGQGPPPHWGYDPRWPAMPFMDPRYGPRPPLDMQGGTLALCNLKNILFISFFFLPKT